MVTSSNGNISALLALCEGNSPVPGEFPSQRPVTRSFNVFCDLRLKQHNNWVNNGDAGDLRRHRAHYGVIVMCIVSFDLRLNKRLGKQSWCWWFETNRAHYDVIIMNRVDHGTKPAGGIRCGFKVILRGECVCVAVSVCNIIYKLMLNPWYKPYYVITR